jgi:exodeoxyribonuclease V beta subunit
LAASDFGRTLDTRWRRTSYTGLTHAANEPRVGSEPERPAMADEPPVELPVAIAAPTPGPEELALRAIPCPLAAMAGGADVGTFVHRVLERTDFAAADLAAEIGRRVSEDGAGRHLGAGDPAVVTAGLVTALQTSLGPLTGERRLCDFTRADRLDELSFEFPMSGGDAAPSGAGGPPAVRPAGVTVADVAGMLDKYLPAADPLAGYPGRLPDAILGQDLRGYLTGSIDLVLRVTDAGRAGRFVVADYKTNWLGPPRRAGDPGALSVWDYRPDAMAEAMQRAHYPLQALLYSVALHRYLRWRLRGYDPAAHLGGVLYLFLRGMAGIGVPSGGPMPCGVFSWQPPPGLVEALSDLLDGRAA